MQIERLGIILQMLHKFFLPLLFFLKAISYDISQVLKRVSQEDNFSFQYCNPMDCLHYCGMAASHGFANLLKPYSHLPKEKKEEEGKNKLWTLTVIYCTKGCVFLNGILDHIGGDPNCTYRPYTHTHTHTHVESILIFY